MQIKSNQENSRTKLFCVSHSLYSVGHFQYLYILLLIVLPFVFDNKMLFLLNNMCQLC